jgi:hypothetical protein
MWSLLSLVICFAKMSGCRSGPITTFSMYASLHLWLRCLPVQWQPKMKCHSYYKACCSLNEDYWVFWLAILSPLTIMTESPWCFRKCDKLISYQVAIFLLALESNQNHLSMQFKSTKTWVDTIQIGPFRKLKMLVTSFFWHYNLVARRDEVDALKVSKRWLSDEMPQWVPMCLYQKLHSSHAWWESSKPTDRQSISCLLMLKAKFFHTSTMKGWADSMYMKAMVDSA